MAARTRIWMSILLVGALLVLSVALLLLSVGRPDATDSAAETIPNPSVESGTTSPQSWITGIYGTNTSTFSWPNTGAHTGTRSLRVDMTAHTSGDAKWYFAPQPITGGALYRYVDWYRSNTSTEVMVQFELSGGGSSQRWLASLAPASAWTRYSTTITPPANATSVTIWHALVAPGFLQTDDYSLTPDIGTGFSRPLVTLTFDDGWANHATVGRLKLGQHEMDGTFYVLSGVVNVNPYMSTAQVLQLQNAGHEIASHTVTHADLPTISSSQQDYELRQSKTDLEAMISAPVQNFCSPYGHYDDAVLAKVRPLYSSHRTVQRGFNTRADTDIYRLRVQNIYSTTTRAEVESWLETARAQGSWLILVYHQLIGNPGPNDTTPAAFEQQLQAIQASGIAVKTMAGAMAEIAPQLG